MLVRPRTSAAIATQSILFSLPHFFLVVFATALVNFASSSDVQLPVARVATSFGWLFVEEFAFVFASSSSAVEGGRPTERSGERVFLATSSVGAEMGSSSRGFFLAGKFSAAAFPSRLVLLRIY
jgi:hypothetical protein